MPRHPEADDRGAFLEPGRRAAAARQLPGRGREDLETVLRLRASSASTSCPGSVTASGSRSRSPLAGAAVRRAVAAQKRRLDISSGTRRVTVS